MPIPALAAAPIAKKLVGKALGGLKNTAEEVLGGLGISIGKGADDKKYAARLYRSKIAYASALDGDPDAVHYLAAVGRLAATPRRILAHDYTGDVDLPKGWTSKNWGEAYKKIIQRARDRAEELAAIPDLWLKGEFKWQNGNGRAQDAEPSSPAPPSPTSEPSAPPAPRPSGPKPCPPGSERNPATNRCRKIPTEASQGYGISAPFSGGGKKPCPPGSERNPDTGRCRKIPKQKGFTRTQNKKLTALQRRAETAAGRVLVKGARGASQAIKAGWAASGLTAGAAAASVAVVLAAAAAAWLIGQDIARSVSGENAQVRKVNAANDRRHARLALQEQLGRMPTLQEQQAITDAYNRRIKLIDQGLPG